MIRVAYICHFSSQNVRKYLNLKSFWFGNILRRVAHIPPISYVDFASWNNDFISILSSFNSYDCHVVSHHLGMKKRFQKIHVNNTNYYFIREKEHLLGKVWKSIIHSRKEKTYPSSAKRIKNVVDLINPDVIIVCGAENPIYSSSALMFNNKPVFVILQTLLNSPKRIELGIGSDFRRELENSIFLQNNYFGTFNLEEVNYIKRIHPGAFCFRLMFPSSVPEFVHPPEKCFDFVFFANGLSKNKGVEDVLKGFSYVHMIHKNVNINIIGSCDESYKLILNAIINQRGIRDRVFFNAHYPRRTDMLNQVMKAKVAVLPGITAPLNSTVRESMYMGIPVIMYENDVTAIINKEKRCVLTARMKDSLDLGEKMLYAYEHPSEMAFMAKSARQYADSFFSEESVGVLIRSIISAIVGHYSQNEPIPEKLLLS